MQPGIASPARVSVPQRRLANHDRRLEIKPRYHDTRQAYHALTRGILSRVLALLALLVAVVGGLGTSTPTAANAPALRLIDGAPLTYSGAGFRANEHVEVITIAGRRAVRRTTATPGGRFVVQFRGMDADPCRGLTAVARGDRGTRATFKRAPGQCPDDRASR
jgi:hypothetical protein